MTLGRPFFQARPKALTATLRWFALFLLGLGTVSAVVEHLLEVRDAARLTASDTFYSVGQRRVRYRLTGADKPAPTIVLLAGLMGSLEQWDHVQTALSALAPVLSYDRGGAGFSDSASAHGASADADELEALLHAPGIAGPFVLVGYSSSSLVAAVFAARHRDLVKGIAFINPSLRTPGTPPYVRIYGRSSLTNQLKAFFGVLRLHRAIVDRDASPRSTVEERATAILESTHHWVASAHDAMSLDRSSDEAAAAMATHPFAAIPLGLLSTADADADAQGRAIRDQEEVLVASSARGLLRFVHCDHGDLLNAPLAVDSVVDLIRTVVNEVRGTLPDRSDGSR